MRLHMAQYFISRIRFFIQYLHSTNFDHFRFIAERTQVFHIRLRIFFEILYLQFKASLKISQHAVSIPHTCTKDKNHIWRLDGFVGSKQYRCNFLAHANVPISKGKRCRRWKMKEKEENNSNCERVRLTALIPYWLLCEPLIPFHLPFLPCAYCVCANGNRIWWHWVELLWIGKAKLDSHNE